MPAPLYPITGSFADLADAGKTAAGVIEAGGEIAPGQWRTIDQALYDGDQIIHLPVVEVRLVDGELRLYHSTGTDPQNPTYAPVSLHASGPDWGYRITLKFGGKPWIRHFTVSGPKDLYDIAKDGTAVPVTLVQTWEDHEARITDLEATPPGGADLGPLTTRVATEETNRAAADTALGGRIDTEATARAAADTALQTAVDGKAGLVHTHTASQVTDLTEQVQDVVGAMLVSGGSLTLNYNDAAGTVTITATGTDAEAVRDTIGAALVGTQGVTVAINDAADTITLGISGLTIAQVTGLQAALDGKATTTALTTHTGDTSNPHATTKAQVGLGNVPNVDATARANHTGTQTAATVSDFAEAVDDRVAALIVAGANMTKTYDDAAGTLTLAASGGGSSGLSGTGSPEGVVTASPGQAYTDTAGTLGAWMWRKRTGTGNTGWVCVEGDTGGRDIRSLLGSGWTYPYNYPPTLRRINGYVRLELVRVNMDVYAYVNIPAGFRPTGVQHYGPTTTAPAVVLAGLPANYLIDNVGNDKTLILDWQTGDAWPTALPGTAV